MPAKKLPRDLTSYDLFKTFAVISMIVDHIGFYLVPGSVWLRVFGRLCVPIWFFLIGYARSRDFGWRLWAGMAILAGANVFAGMSIFPLNILATMIVIRAVIDPVMKAGMKNRQTFWAFSVMLLFVTVPSGSAFEYGTQAILMALFGWLVRHSDEIPDSRSLVPQYLGFSLFTFLFLQSVIFGFNQAQILALGTGLFIVMGLLFFFKPATYPALTRRMGPLASLFRFTGRRTLEIYVAHLLILKALALWWQPDYFVFLSWKWFSPTGL